MNNLGQHTSLTFECTFLLHKCCAMFIVTRYFYCRPPIVSSLEISGGLILTKISTGFLCLTTKPDILQIVKNIFLLGLEAREILWHLRFLKEF